MDNISRNFKEMNHQKLPLTEVMITVPNETVAGAETSPTKEIPAIHQKFIIEHPYYNYIEYELVPLDPEDSFRKYSERVEKYMTGIETLLQADYHTFWCYLTCSPGVQALIRSFLMQYTPPYHVDLMDERSRAAYTTVVDGVGKVLRRATILMESAYEYMTLESIVQLLAGANLLSIATLMKILTIYNPSDKSLCCAITRLHLHPASGVNLYSEFNIMVYDNMNIMQGMGCAVMYGQHNYDLSLPPPPEVFDPYWYHDFILRSMDCLTFFESTYRYIDFSDIPPCWHDLPMLLGCFFNYFYSAVYEAVDKNQEVLRDQEPIRTEILKWLEIARAKCLKTFHALMTDIVDELTMSRANPVTQKMLFQRYIKIITDFMHNKYGIYVYNLTYDVASDMTDIVRAFPEADRMTRETILQCLEITPRFEHILRAKCETERREYIRIMQGLALGSTPPQPTNVELTNLIEKIHDLVPMLGCGFLMKALQHYDYSVADVICDYMEDRFPPCLRAVPGYLMATYEDVFSENRYRKQKAKQKEAEQKGAEQKEAEQKGAEQKEVEQKEVKQKGAEQKGAEQKRAEQKEAEQKEAEQKGAEQKGAEPEMADEAKAVEKDPKADGIDI